VGAEGDGGMLLGREVREQAHARWRYPIAWFGSMVVKGKLPGQQR